ncbi:hypothetical protein NDU88_004722 [Pleurodeles waltl]|uniref:Uncharacterized protein n=1 Tax=Pleurodeles waltl TaxID=8319 RepID=A0AAV7WWT4_PLEWA|nr:hypothetical protein NDU88_004722 [Pleurodeles waltl]
MDSSKKDRPERRTAHVARELSRDNILIAALGETRFPDEGQLTEVKASYTFFWSGRSSDECCESGVDAFCDDEETSIKIRYRTDGRLFNLWRLQAKTKVEEEVRNFLFTDDCALNAATET